MLYDEYIDIQHKILCDGYKKTFESMSEKEIEDWISYYGEEEREAGYDRGYNFFKD